MRCRKARKLITLYVAPKESWLSREDRHALESHIEGCEWCRRDCRESRAAIGMLQENWPISEDTANLLKREGPQERHGVSTRIIELQVASRRVAVWAVAACLVISVLGGWTLLDWRAKLAEPDRSVALSSSGKSLMIAVVGSGDRIIPGTVIQTEIGEMRELLLNGRHQVVVRGGSRLAIQPLAKMGRAGCLVNLTLGEIYVHVEHDGNPFMVQTAHGRAVITGTTFDIKAAKTGTTLVVAEGSVRFEAEDGAVQVTAGQQSMIAASSRWPDEPVACDVVALTTWARGGPNVTQQVEDVSVDALRVDDLRVTLSRQSETRINLDGIRCMEWAERNRNWFKRQFPWIFDLKDALDREGIDVHYVTLLLQSGDIWRFAYPQAGTDRQVEPDWDALLKVASHYGRDESWLKKQTLLLPRAISREEQAMSSMPFTYWTETIEAQVDTCSTAVFPDSLNACTYLIHTRTLAALAIRRNLVETPIGLNEDKVLSLLDSQLEALADCQRLLQQLLVVEPKASCGYSDEVGRLVQKIREISELERNITLYGKAVRFQQRKP
jgi:hypothetical protein